MNSRGVAARWPVLLGGAALTRAYVENDLAEVYEGEVRYARDAFEGLRLMDARRSAGQARRAPRGRRAAASCGTRAGPPSARRARRRPTDAAGRTMPGPLRRRRPTTRSRRRRSGAPGWSRASRWPTTPRWLDERATFLGQWGLRGARGGDGPVVRGAGRDRGPAAAAVLAGPAVTTEGLLEAAVVYGYFPCCREGDDLVVLDEPTADAPSACRFTFPRQRRDRHLCLADFFRPARVRARSTSSASSWSRSGTRISEATAELFADERLPRLPRAARAVACSSPRRSPSTGTRGSARSSGFGAGEDPDDVDGLLRAGLPRVRATRSATAPAPTSRTAPRSSSCCSPSASASSCPRSSSCTPSSRPTRSSSTTPRRSTSMPAMSRGLATPCCGTWTARSSTPRSCGRSRCTTPRGGWAARCRAAARDAVVGGDMATHARRALRRPRPARDPARMRGPRSASSTTAPPSCSRAGCRGGRAPARRCGWSTAWAGPPRW